MTSNTQIHILNITVNIDKHIDIQYQLDVVFLLITRLQTILLIEEKMPQRWVYGRSLVEEVYVSLS
jgi:hypothetical protein